MSPIVPEITEREERLLLLLADGHGLREIAVLMQITELRARKVRDEARRRLGLATTTAAVAHVVRARERSVADG